MADVLPDPYRAVFRHAETTVDYAQVDIDQLPGVVHRVGVDSGVCFGQDGGDGFGVGIVSADQLCKGVPVCRDDLPAGRFHGFGEGGRAIFEPQRSEVESGVIDRRHGGSGDAVQYYFFAVHRSVGFSDLTLPAFHRALKVLRAKWGMSRP